MTYRELITASLRLIGVIATGETPSADQITDGLFSLNDMIESWSNDGLLIFEKKREVFSLVAAQQTYTMGVSGNFNTSRPIEILGAGVSVNGVEFPLQIQNIDQWQMVTLKSTSMTFPTRLYIEDSFPLKNLIFWPIPSEVNSAIIYSKKPLTAVSSVDDTVTLPPGYSRALRYNLVLEIAPEYGKEVSSRIDSIATSSKAGIERVNTKPVYMTPDAYGMNERTFFNIYTGE